MRTLTKYLLKDYLTAFLVALLVITFAFCIGAVYKVIDLMAKGISPKLVGLFFLYNIPYSLSFTIPIASLFSALLLFGRLSSDSELAALKSGGLSLWQIVSPLLLVSLGLSALCFYVNAEVYPKTTYANRRLIKGLGVEDPVRLLEEGRFVRDFPGYVIYVGQKSRRQVRDLVVYELDRETGRATSCVRARSGEMSVDKASGILEIDLRDVRIEIPDRDEPDNAAKTRYLDARNYPIRLDFRALMGRKEVSKKRKNKSFSELVYTIRNPGISKGIWLDEKLQKRRRGRHLIELSERTCLAVAPFTFILLGIPLGIKSHRKESSAGLIMSLAIVFLFYLFFVIADALEDKPELHPWLISWIATFVCQAGGLWLLRRSN